MRLDKLDGPMLAMWVARAFGWEYDIAPAGEAWHVTVGGSKFDPEHDDTLSLCSSGMVDLLQVGSNTWCGWVENCGPNVLAATPQLAAARAVVASSYPELFELC